MVDLLIMVNEYNSSVVLNGPNHENEVIQHNWSISTLSALCCVLHKKFLQIIFHIDLPQRLLIEGVAWSRGAWSTAGCGGLRKRN